jgi:DNA-binding NarL/FixJ family response regulator
VSELQSLSGAPENTIYSFLHKLAGADPKFVATTEVESEGRGRPRKRYSITDLGVAHLTRLNYERATRFGEGEVEKEELTAVQTEEAAPQVAPGLIKVIVADNEGIFRRGLAKSLGVEDDFRVVAQVTTTQGMKTALDKFHYSVLIFSDNLQSDLQELVGMARAFEVKLIVIADFGHDPKQYTSVGVNGVIYRNVSVESLVQCVREVSKGQSWVQETKGSQETEENDVVGARVRDRLTARELKIVALVVQGYKNKEIATQLGTTEQVIKGYLRNLFDKIEVFDREDLASHALRYRLLEENVGAAVKQREAAH